MKQEGKNKGNEGQNQKLKTWHITKTEEKHKPRKLGEKKKKRRKKRKTKEKKKKMNEKNLSTGLVLAQEELAQFE